MALGARVDFPSLEQVPGVTAALAADETAIDRSEGLRRVTALLRDPAARL